MLKEKFIEYIKFEKRYSIHTFKSYLNDLTQYLDFLQEKYPEINPEKADHNIIRSWVVELHNNDISNRSINRKLSTLKSFYKYLLKNQLVEENPMQKIRSPKNAKRTPVFVEEDALLVLFDQVGFDDGFEGLRDKVVLELLYCTGMRVSELISIKDNDIDLSNQVVRVIGKRNKQRIIPISKRLTGLISEYLGLKKNQKSFSCVSLILTNKGNPSYHKMIYRLVQNYLAKVTTVSKKSPHVLRHTFATHMLNRGADLNAIKEILGHSNLSATEVYTHNTIDKLKTIYKQAHPRA